MAGLGAPITAPPPDGDQTRGLQIIAGPATLLAISTILLSLRLFTRFVIVKRLGLDDFFVFIGVVSNLL